MTTAKGYEGEGGLHALLDGKGWITSLSAGSVVSASDFQLYRLSMSLTQEGERHIDDIIDLCHRFLALLKERSPEKRIQVSWAVYLMLDASCFLSRCMIPCTRRWSNGS